MLTPSEIQEKVFKAGLGYDKKDVEQFLAEISLDYQTLQQENIDLKKKNEDLTDSVAYYKSIEKTLQKALILAEKTAQDTKTNAYKEAEAIEKEAKLKAINILADSRSQIEQLEHKTINLMQQYELFKIHFQGLLQSQMDLMNSKSFSIHSDDFSYQEENRFSKEACITEEPQTVTQPKEIEDPNQIEFDFLREAPEELHYQTEDGFEFITIKDE